MALPSTLVLQPATIAASGTLTTFIPLGPYVPVGVFTDSAWTTAKLSLQVSPDGGTTNLELTDVTGAEIVVGSGTAIPASTYAALAPAQFQGFSGCKIRSGTSASSTTQSSSTVVTLALRAAPLA